MSAGSRKSQSRVYGTMDGPDEAEMEVEGSLFDESCTLRFR